MTADCDEVPVTGATERGAADASPPVPPPDGWLCRSCACILGVPFKYPPTPWAYCARAGCAMTPEEQLVALARVQLAGDVQSAGVNATGTGVTDIMSIPEAARLLRRSVKGVYRLAAAGGLPGASKMGGRWVVSRAALLRSVSEGRVPPRRSRR